MLHVFAAVDRPVIDCGVPEAPDNGRVTALWGTTVGSFAWYFCHQGFDLIGARIRTCTVSGKWEPLLPICQSKQPQQSSFL